jgi:archaellum component FlaG (FlaF/FlaG flagellin family)
MTGESAYGVLNDNSNEIDILGNKGLLSYLPKSKFVKRVALILAMLTAPEALAKGFDKKESQESAREMTQHVIKIVQNNPDVKGVANINGRPTKMYEKNIGTNKKIHTNDAFTYIKESKETEKGTNTIFRVDTNNDGKADEIVLVRGKVEAKDEALLSTGFAGESVEDIRTEIELGGVAGHGPAKKGADARLMYFVDASSGKWFGADFGSGEVIQLSDEKAQEQQVKWEAYIGGTVAELNQDAKK